MIVAPRPHSSEADARMMLPVRSKGDLALVFRRTPRGTEVAKNYQAGCMRMRFLPGEREQAPTAVLLNTSGGLADGDRIDQSIEWSEGARAGVTTQAAEKVYRAMDTGASVDTRLFVRSGADAEWLPQETILFDRARLTRSMQVDVAGDARFLGLEAVILGRTAMGERVQSGAIVDRWRIRRDGRLVYADVFALHGDLDAQMGRPAIGDGAAAMAVIVLVAREASALLAAVRTAIADARGVVAASSWNDMLAVRLLAPDGATLRANIALALRALRGGRPLARVWSC